MRIKRKLKRMKTRRRRRGGYESVRWWSNSLTLLSRGTHRTTKDCSLLWKWSTVATRRLKMPWRRTTMLTRRDIHLHEGRTNWLQRWGKRGWRNLHPTQQIPRESWVLWRREDVPLPLWRERWLQWRFLLRGVWLAHFGPLRLLHRQEYREAVWEGEWTGKQWFRR